MSVHLQMLGRQLPCNLLDLLQVKPLPLASPLHDDLVRRIEGGENYPDVHYKLGLSHLGRQELGLARKHLAIAVEQKPQYVSARLALATVCDLLARHTPHEIPFYALQSLGLDGKDEPLYGNPGTDTGSVRIVSDRINEIIYKKGGKVTQVLTNVLSPDGDTIGVMYMRMDPEGKVTKSVTFATYERIK